MPDERKQIGFDGENLAAEFLRRKGYLILDRNVGNNKIGELDIIAQDGETLVFVEVKTFKNASWSSGPLENMTAAKQRQVLRAAKAYLGRLRKQPYVRFDVVTVWPGSDKPIEHYEGAFSE